jgi:hypothetical protein
MAIKARRVGIRHVARVKEMKHAHATLVRKIKGETAFRRPRSRQKDNIKWMVKIENVRLEAIVGLW